MHPTNLNCSKKKNYFQPSPKKLTYIKISCTRFDFRLSSTYIHSLDDLRRKFKIIIELLCKTTTGKLQDIIVIC